MEHHAADRAPRGAERMQNLIQPASGCRHALADRRVELTPKRLGADDIEELHAVKRRRILDPRRSVHLRKRHLRKRAALVARRLAERRQIAPGKGTAKDQRRRERFVARGEREKALGGGDIKGLPPPRSNGFRLNASFLFSFCEKEAPARRKT